MAFLTTYDEKSTGFYSFNRSSYLDAPNSLSTPFYLASGSFNKAYGLLDVINFTADSDSYSLGSLSAGTHTLSASSSYWFYGSGYASYITPTINVYNSSGLLVSTTGTTSIKTFSTTSSGTYFAVVTGVSYQASQYDIEYTYSRPENSSVVSDVILSGTPAVDYTISVLGTYSDANGISSSTLNYFWYVDSVLVSTNSSYKIQPNDAGKYIWCLIQFRDDAGYSETFGTTFAYIPAVTAADTTAPTIAVSSSTSALTAGNTATITFSLSEASSNFTASDVTATGGTLSNFSGSGTAYTALFTPATNSTTNGVVRVASGVFTDAAGNANADGSDANNTVTMTVNTVPVVVTQTNTLSVIVDKGVLGSDAVLLKDLKEITTTLDGRIQSHTVEYAGVVYGFAEIDPLITTVTRDGEFTQEFRVEIAQAYPGVENILYVDAVAIVGIANIDQILLGVAGFDGDFVN